MRISRKSYLRHSLKCTILPVATEGVIHDLGENKMNWSYNWDDLENASILNKLQEDFLWHSGQDWDWLFTYAINRTFLKLKEGNKKWYELCAFYTERFRSWVKAGSDAFGVRWVITDMVGNTLRSWWYKAISKEKQREWSATPLLHFFLYNLETMEHANCWWWNPRCSEMEDHPCLKFMVVDENWKPKLPRISC